MVAYALRPKQRPARDETYADLVGRFRHDDAFAELVKAICFGMGLIVLDVDNRHGIVVASTGDSVFAVKMTDYAKRTGGEGKAHERVLHALAHLGTATLAYPRPADLANPAYVGRVTVNGVEAFVREATRRLAEVATESNDQHDPPADAPDLEAAWRVYSRRASTPSSGDGRRVASSTIGMVGKALSFLADQGMLTRRSDDDGGTYLTTSRYRVQVLEAGSRMFAELISLGVTEVTDGNGTLAPIEWTEKDVNQL
ncbi:hypothetical protein JWS13_04115 (plasmid) [Rhodococcus pseudokoreensis]|uniref:DNA-binding protein n=1 Tax=Rhodococcus pseudokoreensis TaxID=2811421 RepID=A0A974ZRM9_9NOCA|nr:hypothetical protein [Rhodococcus pseudokoreensis]QSE87851.1 hypothetical protein JWS13_04115 [Rhodococcus pseudokoreensis]